MFVAAVHAGGGGGGGGALVEHAWWCTGQNPDAGGIGGRGAYVVVKCKLMNDNPS